MDPFASHVIRAVLLLLSPGHAKLEDQKSALRSKKSAAWKARQGTMKSLFNGDKGKGVLRIADLPPQFQVLARQFVECVRSELNENEIRALAANKVASPSLQVRFVPHLTLFVTQ